MTKVKLDRALCYIRHILADQDPRDSSDGELLQSFLSSDNQHAFEQLVTRHAGLVFGVCRRVLQHQQDAEDAFQATFLALVRQASTIRKHQSVASWLYGVARNMAKDVRQAANRRRKYEKCASSPEPADNPALKIAWAEAQEILDQEIELLPAGRREAFILCCLENRSCADVAKTLGTKEGTIWSRVAWAKKRLQARLTKRGISLFTLLAATAVSNGARVPVPAGLVGSTALAATQIARGVSLAGAVVSPNVIALLNGMPRALTTYSITTAALVFLCLGLAMGGIAIAVGQSSDIGQAAAPPVVQATVDKPEWLEGSGKDQRIRLSGKILNEAGTPANGCKLTVMLNTEFTTTNLPIEMDGHRFQAWIPVGLDKWFVVYVKADSPDGKLVGLGSLSAIQLRQAALDGLVLTVKPPERTVDVSVLEKSGEPVRDAFVLASDDSNFPFMARTNDKGLASFPLRNRDKLSQLTAWTEDFKIGGYSFHRDPPRDPSGNKFIIELDPCRPQVIRVINEENKAPIPDLKLVLTVGTGAPNYQFIGKTPACEMTTNQKGEAVYRWFPDWKTHGSYISIPDPHWTKVAKEETIDGVLLVKVKKSRFDARKRVIGQVRSTGASVAGLHVEIWSHQGEEQNRADMLFAFTDDKGNFAADYLPGSTYCIFVNDARYVSDIIDLIPNDSHAHKTNAPSLTISEGKPVEIIVTSGSARIPVAHQQIQLETPHWYSWRENGKVHNSPSGRRWMVTTDAQGKAHTFALSSEKIVAKLFSPDWRSEVSTDVKANGVTWLELHREVAAARTIRGRLQLPGGLIADVNQAVMEIGSLDDETKERLTCRANDKGEFQFESKSTRIGIYARTRDARAATVAILDRVKQPVTLDLKPTGEYLGQLLGKEARPLNGYRVRAEVLVTANRDNSKPFPASFLAATFDARTDSLGNFSFSGLPCGTAIRLSADSVDGSDRDKNLGSFYLTAHESRPRIVSRLGRPARKTSFAQRYDATLRDCRLSNFGAMVLLYRPGAQTSEFVDDNFINYHTTKQNMAFMQFKVALGDKSDPEIEQVVQSKHWPLPGGERIFALAMDPAGRELGRIEIEATDPAGPKRAADFVRQHAPAPLDARHKWDEAFAEARKTNRKVWARISGRYCQPCFSLTRWLDDHKELLALDYVFLKIDDVLDLHGAEVAKRLTGSERQGVPFYAVFNPAGALLITSESPLGNIGHPDGFEGKKHLRKMLLNTRNKLTEQQVDALVNTLED